MLPRKSPQLEDKSLLVGESGNDYRLSNLCSSALKPFKIDGSQNYAGMDLNDKPKTRRSLPAPTPVQSNPMFLQPPSYSKLIMSSPCRQRRGSFLYKQDSSTLVGDVFSQKFPTSKNISYTTNDDIIITPFAQILAKLRSVRSNHMELTNIYAPKSNDGVWITVPNLNSPAELQSTSSQSSSRKSMSSTNTQLQDENSCFQLAKEIGDDLDWCLNQLSAMKTNMSVSDMARTKFKSMLDKQLNLSKTEAGKGMEEEKEGNHQTQKYIFSTFLDREANIQLLTPSNTAPCLPTSRLHALRGSISIDDSETPTSGDKIPKFGIKSDQEEELENIMNKMDNWGMDIFRLDEITNHQPLTALVYTIFRDRNLLKTFKIQKKTCIIFLIALENSYLRGVPYHNSKHACDVTQTTQVLLKMNSLEDVFTPLEILSALLAAAVHDAGHPGLTNQFLINTSSELALLYNDESVLENYHVSTAFKLLQKDECNILANFSKEERNSFRKMVIDLVLATDMSKHMTLLADMKTMLEHETVTCETAGTLKLDNYSDRMSVLRNMLHCADLSNPTKPLPLYIKWCELVMEEFFQQGDRERNSNMEISPMCDRYNTAIEKTQVGFIDFVVRPVWETWADLVNPDAQDILDTLEKNRQYYQSKLGALRSRTTSLSKGVKEEDEAEEVIV